ncbi:MAG: metallophosphoesterase family protein [Syntrophobacteria bacterium]
MNELNQRVAIIADSHANLQGIELCFQKITSLGVDQVLCCGDLVGYGNEPNEVVEFCRVHGIQSIAGNHDRLVCRQCPREGWSEFALRKVDWTRSVLTEANFTYLYNLPLYMVTDDYCVVHGAWSDPDKYLFEERDFFEELELLPARLVFHGHTHIPGVFQFLLAEGKFDYRYLMPTRTSDVYVKLPDESSLILVSFVNPGTVGYPRGVSDQGSFVVWETETGKVTYHFYPLFA